MNGYQIVEPPALSELLAATGASEITVALLSWLVEVTREELKDNLQGAEIEVIRAEYHGPYPAIGIRYASVDAPDLALIEDTIARMLQDRVVLEFVAFLKRGTMDWRHETERLLGAKRVL